MRRKNGRYHHMDHELQTVQTDVKGNEHAVDRRDENPEVPPTSRHKNTRRKEDAREMSARKYHARITAVLHNIEERKQLRHWRKLHLWTKENNKRLMKMQCNKQTYTPRTRYGQYFHQRNDGTSQGRTTSTPGKQHQIAIRTPPRPSTSVCTTSALPCWLSSAI